MEYLKMFLMFSFQIIHQVPIVFIVVAPQIAAL